MPLDYRNSRRFLLVFVVLLLAAVAACSDENSAADDGSGNADDTETIENGPDVDEQAPDPEQVEADDLEIIDEWQEAGVPRFRGGEVLDFEPHASRVENGGTLLVDGVNASADEVIAFYRGALTALGWEERRVGEREMTAQNDIASLLVTVSVYDDQTLIMMILTDNLGNS